MAYILLLIIFICTGILFLFFGSLLGSLLAGEFLVSQPLLIAGLVSILFELISIWLLEKYE